MQYAENRGQSLANCERRVALRPWKVRAWFPGLPGLMLLVALATESPVWASEFRPPTHTFNDAELFVEATGASDLTGALPQSTGAAEVVLAGEVAFLASSPGLLEVGPWVEDQTDPFQLRVIGPENLELVPDEPVFSVGFEVQEARFDSPFLDGDFGTSVFEVTLCLATFPAGFQCPESQVIDSVNFSPKANRPGDQSGFFGVWSHLPVAQVSIREMADSGDGNEFFGRVLGGALARPFANLDRFENDDQPALASFLRAELVPSSFEASFRQIQSLHAPGDQDWIYHGSNVADLEFSITSDQSEFHAVAEFYSVERLTDAQTPPLFTLGNCQGPPGHLTLEGAFPAGSQLVRVVNCGVTEPVRYEVSLNIIEFGTIVVGTLGAGFVIEEQTGRPQSLAMISDAGELFFSNPVDGGFLFVALANVDTTLTVISPLFEADPVLIPGIDPFDVPAPVTVVVRPRPPVLFADSFER